MFMRIIPTSKRISMDEKYEEYKEAIKTGEFSDEYNLTNKDLEKLKSDSVTTVVPTLLDMMFTGADFVLPNAVAKEVYEDFQCLYKQYLGRELTAAEKYVFDSAIKIMIWKVHGKTFSKICQERYAYVSNVAQRRFLAKAGQQNRADNLPVRYIAGYSDIPDKELRAYPLFPVGTKGKDVDYDRIVYDTYDFLDKLNIEYQRIDHEPAMTMEVCAEIDKALKAMICKNLFLCNRQETNFYLLMIPADKKFKTKDLSAQLSVSRLSFGKEEYMEKFLDITPGSVSVMGLMNDTDNNVRLIIDEDVFKDEYFGCHPCINTSSIRLRMSDLTDIILPAMNHTPTIVNLP